MHTSTTDYFSTIIYIEGDLVTQTDPSFINSEVFNNDNTPIGEPFILYYMKYIARGLNSLNLIVWRSF
jgi:hypothetical protein